MLEFLGLSAKVQMMYNIIIGKVLLVQRLEDSIAFWSLHLN